MLGGGGDLNARGRVITRNAINANLADLNSCGRPENAARCDAATAWLAQLILDTSPAGNVESALQLSISQEVV